MLTVNEVSMARLAYSGICHTFSSSDDHSEPGAYAELNWLISTLSDEHSQKWNPAIHH